MPQDVVGTRSINRLQKRICMEDKSIGRTKQRMWSHGSVKSCVQKGWRLRSVEGVTLIAVLSPPSATSRDKALGWLTFRLHQCTGCQAKGICTWEGGLTLAVPGSEGILKLSPLIKEKWFGPSQQEHGSSGICADVGSHDQRKSEEWSTVGFENKAAIEF